MTAYTKSDFKKCSHVHARERKEIVEDINCALESTEFIFRPLNGYDNDGIPYGFYTIGMARFGLPEIYVSGIAINDINFCQLYPHLKLMHEYLTQGGYGRKTVVETVMAMNREWGNTNIGPFFQVRPVDPERLCYGQAQMLRYWAEDQQCLDTLKAVQIVWRNTPEDPYPLKSTNKQLLLDYVPFGTPVPKDITEIVHATA